MSRTITAADRSALIRLANSLPAGSEERKAILAGLKKSAGDLAGLKADLEKIRIPVLELGDYMGTGLPSGVEKALEQFVSQSIFLSNAIRRGR
jgi:hypothetical protein